MSKTLSILLKKMANY